MEFVDFYDRWINRYLRRHETPFSSDDSAEMDDEFRHCIDRHRSAIPDAGMAWGWKEPRSLYLLPFFHERYPEMKFLHVVRHGLDMAFSPNQNQLRKHGDAVLGDAFDALPTPVRSGALWCRVNEIAANYGEAALGSRYLRMRFEDICDNPAAATRAILAFIGRQPTGVAEPVEVTPPGSIGRWQAEPDGDLVAAIRRHAQPGLTRFGYGG